LWDARTGKERLTWPGHLDEIRGVAWSHDGKRIATGCGGDGTIRVWDARSGAPGTVFRLAGGPRRSRNLSMLAFSSDGRALIGHGQRWSLDTGRPTQSLPTGWRMAYSRDGKLAAVVEDREG